MGAATFRVLWGDPFHGLTQELVEAHDVDEALTVASALRPDLPRARTAFIVAAPGAPSA